MRSLGEQMRKREERITGVACEGMRKINACTHSIVQAVSSLTYERGYPIGYFTLRDPRMFFKDVTASPIDSLITYSDLNQQQGTMK